MRGLNGTGATLLARLVAGEHIPLCTLLYLGLTVPQYFACGALDRAWNSQAWAALDIDIGQIDETVDSRNGLRFAFPGVTSPQLALALAEDCEGAAVQIYVGLCDPDTGVVGDAMLMWSGELDMPGWQDGAEALVIFTAEHREEMMNRPKPSRYTDSEQQRLFPGDTSLDFDPATDAAPLVWPAASYFKV